MTMKITHFPSDKSLPLSWCLTSLYASCAVAVRLFIRPGPLWFKVKSCHPVPSGPHFVQSHTGMLSQRASWGCFWPKITYPPENIFGSVVNVAQAGMTHWRENSNLSRASWLGQGQKLWAQALPEASVNLLLESFPNSKSMSSSQGSQPRPWA